MDTAPVHLNGKVKTLSLCVGNKSMQLSGLRRSFRKTRCAGKLHEIVQVTVETLDEALCPWQSDQCDARLWQCDTQRAQRGDGAQHVTELKCTEDRNALWLRVVEAVTWSEFHYLTNT